MLIILSILIVIAIVLLWFMLYRYTDHYQTLKQEFKELIEESQHNEVAAGKSVTWGDTPKHTPTGKWQKVEKVPRVGKSADEPQLLLGGLTYREAQKEVLKELNTPNHVSFFWTQ